MEGGVYGGLEELFSGSEKESFDSFLIANNVGVLETNVSENTSPDNNVFVSVDLQEQASSNDGTDVEMVDPLLDEDLDEVMENFRKRSQESEQISEEMISQKDDEDITVAALLDLEQNLVVHDGEKEVHHDETLVRVRSEEEEEKEIRRKGKRPVVFADDDDVQRRETVPGGFTPSDWRNRYHDNYNNYFSWSARHANNVRPTPGVVLGRSAPVQVPVPSTFSSSSSSSFSGGDTRPAILLGGLVDIRPLLVNKNNTSWNNNIHGGILGQPSYSSSFSTSLGASWNNFCQGESSSKPKRRRKRKEIEVTLPPGWSCVKRVRQNGRSKGQSDKYYLNDETNRRCRSLPELYRYLNLQ